MEFQPFPKVPRLSREVIVTEKIDGTNASVTIGPASNNQKLGHLVGPYIAVSGDYVLSAGSRKRFITPEGAGPKGCDNFGFAAWVRDNSHELVKLGEGTHYGEWWGQGIQRTYGLRERRFSLFNVHRWLDTHVDPVTVADGDKQVDAPACCHVVPVLWRGDFTDCIGMHEPACMNLLRVCGSRAAPGFTNPEGIMIYHTAARQYFKKTFEGDEKGKGE